MQEWKTINGGAYVCLKNQISIIKYVLLLYDQARDHIDRILLLLFNLYSFIRVA